MVNNTEYTNTGGTCPFCGGALWKNDTHTLCEECDTSFGEGEKPSSTPATRDPWDEFQHDRPTYSNSGIPRCVGGFPGKYDWVRSDEIDGPVSSLTADDFYQ